MQTKYEGQIRIKKGIELGVQPHLLHKYDSLMENHSFDFIICSMHTAEKKGLHSGDFFKDKTIEEAYKIYYEELLYCVKNL